MLIDRTCRGCAHFRQLHGDTGYYTYGYCNYILDTGRPRPCPAGKGCTVRQGRQKKGGMTRGAR